MSEILTESFCERCGTRYTFESARPKVRLEGVRVLSRGLKNFVLSDDTTMDEAMAAARGETDREVTAHQLDAFHKTFTFCMSCRQYTCPNCWNEVEARCLSCAPHIGHEIMPAPFPSPATVAEATIVAEPSTNRANGHLHDEVEIEAVTAVESEAVAVEPVAVAELEPVMAAQPEPEPEAPPPAADVVEQPTWRITAPDADSPTDPPSTQTDATIPLPTNGSPLPPAEPQWPAKPEWPAARASVELPFPGRPAEPQGGVDALWAASNQELVATPPTPGRSSGGIQPCVSCGLSLSATARFCRRCGTIQGG